jgi:hypothetical protein
VGGLLLFVEEVWNGCVDVIPQYWSC